MDARPLGVYVTVINRATSFEKVTHPSLHAYSHSPVSKKLYATLEPFISNATRIRNSVNLSGTRESMSMLISTSVYWATKALHLSSK